MPKQTSIAKITRPRLPKVLYRRRLFGLLDRGIRSPVTWVSGPAGSGKTTLVASYLDARKLPCLWYQLDEGDSDIATFFYYLGLAARKVAPRHRTHLPLLTMEYMRGVPTFTKRFFENLCSRLKPPYVIVLDNYHHIAPESPFHDVIRDALSVIPEGIAVTVVSRSGPPPSLSLLRTYNKMHFIGWEELKFDMKETGSLLRLGHRRGLTGDMLEQLHRMTSGWAAGLMLMMERLRTRGMGPGESDLFKTDELFEYFATELFEKTDRKTQDFLLKTAFLPRIAPRAAIDLTGRDDAWTLLATLSRNHFFTEQRSISDPVYQYHPLFREFLQARARETYSSHEILAILCRAAQILEGSGQIEDAAELYSLSAEWQSFARLVLANASTMLSQGRNRSLEAWLKTIPEDILDRDPWLLYWMGACRMPFALLEGRRYFEKAFTLFRKRRDAAGVFLAWSGVVESIIQELGDLGQMDPWIALLDALIKEYPIFPSPQIEGQVTARIFMALSLRRPWHPAFEAWKDKATALLDSNAEASLRLLCGFYLLTHFLQIGDPAACEQVMRTMRDIISSNKNVSPLAYIMGKMADAWLAWTICSYENCLKMMHDGLEKSGDSGVHLWDHLLLTMGLCASMSTGDVRRAEPLLEKMASALDRGRPLDKFYYYLMATWYYRVTQDLPRAQSQAKLGLDLATSIGFLGAEVKIRLAAVNVMRVTGKYEEARGHIVQGRRIGRKVKSPLIEFYCLLLEARIAFAEGHEAAGLQYLRDGMRLGRERGYAAFNFSGWTAEEYAFLCVKALEAGIEPGFVEEMIRKRNLVPESPPLHVGNWPWAVKIYTLGRFEIIRDGTPLHSTGKVQKKPLEMLKVLIAFGRENVSEEQITDALWPDADGDTARLSFKTTLHRLRQLLGTEEFIHLQEGRISLDPRTCWIDTAAFETMAEHAGSLRRASESARGRSANRNPDTTQYLDLLEKAVAMYDGHYLGTEGDKPWATSLKERLRSKFLDAVTLLGGHWAAQAGTKRTPQAQETMKKAIACFQRGLEIDDVAEDFYQNLMTCYGKLGRKAEAAKVYKRCRATLFASLGVEPSEETEGIYRSIMKQ